MNVGFTGSRNGMTPEQKEEFVSVMEFLKIDLTAAVFHHGDCVGADAEAHDIAKEMGFVIVIHPPESVQHRAWSTGADLIVEEKTYLARNRDIVINSDILIGTPPTNHHISYGGSWYTIDYSKKIPRCQTFIIYPNGLTNHSF